MPETLEKELKNEARKKFGSTTSKRARKYIYGTMRKTGWVPSTQKRFHKSIMPELEMIETYHDKEIEIR